MIAVLSIAGYGVFVFAQPFAPGAELDPACAPTDNTCVVIQAWEQNLVDGVVFNDSANIAIGTDTTTKKFTVKDGIFELNLDSVAVLPADHLLVGFGFNTVPGAGFTFVDTVNNISMFNGVWDTTDFGGEPEVNLIYITPDTDSTITLGADGIISSVNNGKLTYYVDNGLIEMISNGFNQAGEVYINGGFQNQPYTSFDAGVVVGTRLLLDSNRLDVNPTGLMVGTTFDPDETSFNLLGDSDISGIINDSSIQGSGIVNDILAIKNYIDIISDQQITGDILLNYSQLGLNDVSGLGGTVSAVYGSSVNLSSTDQRNVTDFFGYEVNMNMGGAGIVENVFGFTLNQLTGTNVFAFHVPSGSLSGGSSEHGLYIADGENYLSNGLRLNYDTDNSKVFVEEMGGTYTLYFGNPNGIPTIIDTHTF